MHRFPKRESTRRQLSQLRHENFEFQTLHPRLESLKLKPCSLKNWSGSRDGRVRAVSGLNIGTRQRVTVWENSGAFNPQPPHRFPRRESTRRRLSRRRREATRSPCVDSVVKPFTLNLQVPETGEYAPSVVSTSARGNAVTVWENSGAVSIEGFAVGVPSLNQ